MTSFKLYISLGIISFTQVCICRPKTKHRISISWTFSRDSSLKLWMDIFFKQRGQLSLVSTTEELLDRKVAAPV
jgi:hypothetical protein